MFMCIDIENHFNWICSIYLCGLKPAFNELCSGGPYMGKLVVAYQWSAVYST